MIYYFMLDDQIISSWLSPSSYHTPSLPKVSISPVDFIRKIMFWSIIDLLNL